MYITNHYYKELPNKIRRHPRERFIRYYTDLYKLEKNSPIDPNSYTYGSQYSYVELGDSVLEQCKNDIALTNFDLVIFCYWSHEFDQDYLCGAYFCDKYNITGTTFDVCDQGIISPATSLTIINSYFKHTECSSALLVCFDQTSIPVEHNFQGMLPSKTSAVALHIEKEPIGSAKYKITDVQVGNQCYLSKIQEKYIKQYKSKVVNVGNIKSPSSAKVSDAPKQKQSTEYNCAEIFCELIKPNQDENRHLIINVMDFESKLGALIATCAL